MTFPEVLIERQISLPCTESDYDSIVNIFNMYLETMRIFGDALEMVNERYDIPCRKLCMEGSIDAFSIETRCTPRDSTAMVDLRITIKLFRPLIKPIGHTVTCINPVMSYPEMSAKITSTLEQQYKCACGQPMILRSCVIDI